MKSSIQGTLNSGKAPEKEGVLLRPQYADIGAGVIDAHHQPRSLRRRGGTTGGA